MPLLWLVILLAPFLRVEPERRTEPYTFIGLDDPEEVLTISGDHRIEGRLVLLGRSQVLVEGAALTLAGDLLIADSAQLQVQRGGLVLEQSLAGHHEIICTDRGRLQLVECRLSGGGFPLRLTLLDRSEALVAGGSTAEGQEWWVGDEARLSLESLVDPGEIVARDQAVVELEECVDAMIWLTPPAGESFRLADVAGGDLALWRSELLGVEAGTFARTTLRHCPGTRFGVHLQDGADVELERCELAAVRLAFSLPRPEPVEVRGLQPLEGEGLRLEAGELSLGVQESRVEAWDIEAAGQAEVQVSASTGLRRLQALDRGTLLVFDSQVDALGAAVRGADQGTLGLIRGAVEGSVTLRGRSLATCHDSVFGPEAVLTVGDSATAAALNCRGLTTPRLVHAGLLVEASLADVVVETGQRAPLSGGARLFTGGSAGPRPADFTLQYRSAGGTAWREARLTGEASATSLGHWDTAGLTPGRYRLRLVVRGPRFGELTLSGGARLRRPIDAAPRRSMP